MISILLRVVMRGYLRGVVVLGGQVLLRGRHLLRSRRVPLMAASGGGPINIMQWGRMRGPRMRGPRLMRREHFAPRVLRRMMVHFCCWRIMVGARDLRRRHDPADN